MGKSGDSYSKKEREKKKKKRKQDKARRKQQRKEEGKAQEFMYQDANGNLVETPPDPVYKKEISLEEIQISTPKQDKTDQPIFVRSGMVKFFNTEKGYGFIQDNETKESFFVHANNLTDEIKDNDKVVFEIGKGPKGPIAVAVKLA
jgi:cold shock CspA family protein